MSTSIDERVVSMEFRNRGFLNGVASTINALASLKKSLNMDSSKKGLDGVNQTMSKMPPPQFAAGLQNVSAKFLALGTIGVTALANITNSAIAAGSQLLKSLTVDPIKMGLEEYETNLNSVQTILANTGLEGQKGLNKVNAKLEELNHYADLTIYNFSEMARNIGTFTAAGVDLDTSTNAIKGIANLAAVSGSNAQQASTAMYQLSQSLAAGKVTLEDWNSVVNAGMGGKLFQEALKETARVHGVAVDSIIKEQGSFRNSLQEGWITSEIMTETLSKFTGDLTKSQLKTMGYTQEQIKEILKMGKTASDAATKVKTMTQLVSTLQEGVQSSWAQTWQLLFGDFDEAKELFTNVNNVLGDMISSSGDARNQLLKDWDKLGGRAKIIEAIGTAFNGIIEVTRPIRNAFRDVFPPVTAKNLLAITQGILNFSKTIKIGETDAENLRRTFAGVFSIFSIVGQIIQGVLGMFGRLFGVISQGSGSFLEFTAGIGDWLVSLDQALKKGEGLTKFFEGLGNVLMVPIALLGALGAVISGAFTGFDEGSVAGIDSALGRIGDRLQPFSAMADLIGRAWGGMKGVLENVWDFMAPFAQGVADIFGGISEAIASSVSDGDFSTILDTINTGLFAALVLGVRKFLSDGSIFDFGGGSDGLVESIQEIFGGLNDTLGALQANLKAGTLIKIAGAVAALTGSVFVLSTIDSGKLTKALTAITVMFLQLSAAMALMDKVGGFGIAVKLAPLAVGLILLSSAVLILSVAVKNLSSLSWEEIGKGLSAVTGILLSLAGAVQLMNGAKLAASAVGFIGLAVAVKILESAVSGFANMSWEEIGRGMTGVAGSLLLIAGAMQLMPANLPITGAGLLIVSGALLVMSGALKIMAGMSWEEIGKGLATLAGSLGILAAAMALMSGAIPGALALLIIAPSLVVLAGALNLMASLSWEEIGKGLTLLAGSLLILAGGMYLMSAALPGAAALIVVAGALAILTPALIAMGNMSWEEIGKGLTMLAATLALIGLAGLALTPVIPSLLGLGAAILLLGAGTLAAGVGLLAFSAGLTALSVAGAAGAAALIAIVSGLIGLIPMAMNAVGEGIVLMANVISNAGPEFTAAITTLLLSLLNAIDRLAPRIVGTLEKLIILLIETVVRLIPRMVDAGLRLIKGILDGIGRNIRGIVQAAIKIVTEFIGGIKDGIPKLTQAGADLVITFVESLASSIRTNNARMQTAGAELASAIIDGMTGGLFSGASRAVSAAADMASQALNAAKNVLGIHSPSREFRKLGQFVNKGFAQGLKDGSRKSVREAYVQMRSYLRETVKDTGKQVKDAEKRLKDLHNARTKDLKKIKKAEQDLARARSENSRAKSAHTVLTKRLDDEYRRVSKLASKYESVSKKLDSANQKLKDAKKTRDDYAISTRDRLADLGQIEGTSFQAFRNSLKNNLKETQQFASELQKLRKNGLNDRLYQELLERGPDALPLLKNLNAAGKSGIAEINKLSADLLKSSSSLGKTASKELYQAGVNAAQGLVNGLKKQQKNLQKQMNSIANYMVKAIKKKLKIKSPSRVFAEIGGWTVEGLTKGIEDNARMAEKASEKLGDDAVKALERATSRKLHPVLVEGLDLHPTITPVVDLSEVSNAADRIDGMLPYLGSANRIKIGRGVTFPVIRDPYESQVRPVAPVNNVSYVQNINAPVAPSPAEVYRNTKTLVASVKGSVGR